MPSRGGVSLSLIRMNKIREVVPEDLYAIVESGIITEELEKALEARELFYPPSPTSSGASTIGGNIATSASGLRSGKYGTTKNFLMGLELVLPTGEIIKTGARTVKSVAGYDLTRLMCGSQGSLAIVTSAILKLLPLPEHRVTILAAFETLEKAAGASIDLTSAGLPPSVLEFLDPVAAQTLTDNSLFPGEAKGRSLVLAETDGFREAAEKGAARIERTFKDSGATFVAVTADSSIADRLWEARRGILRALSSRTPALVLGDITVPRSRIITMLQSIIETGRSHGLSVAVFGHAVSGNLHPAIMLDESVSEKAPSIERALSDLAKAVQSLGGVVTGEYGIGIERKGVPDRPGSIERKLKEEFDPKGILNPGRPWHSSRS